MKKQIKPKMKNSKLIKSAKAKAANSVLKKKIKSFLTAVNISEHKQMKEASETPAMYWQTIFDSLSDGICLLDKDQHILQCNKAMSTVFKKSNDEMIGKHCWEIVHGTKEPIPNCPILRMKKSLKSEKMELNLGDSWFDVTVDPIFDVDKKIIGAVHIVRDITERKRVEERVQTSELFLMSIINQSPYPMWISDHQGTLIKINRACLDLLHISEDEVVGKYNVLEDNIVKEQGYMSLVESVLRDGTIAKFELRYDSSQLEHLKLKRHNFLILDVTIFPIRDANGKISNAVIQHIDVTERKQAEKALRESEESYRMLVDALPVVVYKVSAEGIIVSLNRVVERLTNWQVDEWIGKPFVGLIHPEDLPSAMELFQKTLHGEESSPTELRIRNKSGDYLVAEFTSSLQIMEGKVIGQLGIARDITERKRVEKELQERDIQFRKLAAQVPGMIYQFKQNLDGTFCVPFASERIRDIFGCSPTDVHDDFSPIAKVILPEDLNSVISSIQDSAQRLAPFHCEYRVQIPGRSIRWMFGQSSPEKQNDGSIIWHGFNVDITERKMAEAELQQKTALLEAQLNSSIDGIIIVDSQGKKILQNQRTVDLWKIPQHIADNPDDRQQVQHVMQMTKNPQQFVDKIIFLYSHPEEVSYDEVELTDGTVLDRYSAPVIDSKGQNYGRIWAFRDITERKQAETALQESENKYRDMVEQINDVLFTTDINGMFTYVSPTIEVIGGYKQEEIVGHHITEFLDPAFIPLIKAQFVEVMAGNMKPSEYRVKTKTGEYKWMRSSSRPILENGKPIGMRGALTDISERKQADEALRESEERYRTLVEVSPDVIYTTTENGTITSLNPAFETITGRLRADWIGKSYAELLHPDDVQDNIERFKKVLLGETQQPHEMRMLSKSGTYLTGEFTSAPYIRDGKIIGTHGIARDITNRKHAEDALKESEERYRLLIENQGEGIGVVDKNEIFTFVNPTAENIFGVSKGKLVGRSFMEFLSPGQDTILFEQNKNRIQGEKSTYEIEIINANGEHRNLLITATPQKTEEQIVIGTFGVFRDITDRKIIENALKTSEIKLKELFEYAPVGYHEIDELGNINAINQTELQMLGYTYGEMIGWPVWEFVDDYEASKTRVLDELKGIIPPNKNIEQRFARKDGTSFLALVEDVILRNERGEITGIRTAILDITDRKIAEEALRETRDYLENLLSFANAPIIVWDSNFKITRFNTAAEKLTGYTMYDVKGKHIEMLLPADSKESSLSLIAHTIEGDYLITVEIPILCKNAEIHTVLWSSANIYTADNRTLVSTIAQGQDITSRKQAEEELQQSNAFNELLLKTMPFGIDIVDEQGRILFVSENMKNMLNVDAVGLCCWELYKDSKQQCDDCPLRKTIEFSKTDSLESTGVLGGKTFQISHVGIMYQGKKAILEIFQDITEQKKLQSQFLQAQKNESIGTLAAGIAHDFNNILGIILAFATMLERSAGDKNKIIEQSRVITQAVNRGAALVRQILTFARKTDVLLAPLNFIELIHELVSMLKQTFPKVINFVEIVDDGIPYINADRSQIHQVLMNLCVNARDAMPNGGSIIIRAEIKTRDQIKENIPAAKQDSYICVSITDTGAGMDEVTRSRIFDPFFTTKEQGKGTGLGLAVVYGVVQTHHGFIDVESKVGHGTTFWLYFPISQVSELPADVSLSTDVFNIGGTETILIIEDEEALIEVGRQLLESKGYKVYTALDGKEAIEVYEQHKQDIALVLTDMGLPGMTGMDVFKKLREIDQNIKVVFASGFFKPDVKSELDKAGAKGFLQKPYSPNEVLRVLREVLDMKKE